MKKTDDHSDIPGTRQSIENIATNFNIFFILSMAIGGAIMFIFGLVMTRADFLNDLPEAGVAMVIGMMAFCLFFPWFTALYFSRHLLYSVRKVEIELQELKDILKDTEPSNAPAAFGAGDI